jgi:hypothetical protein
LVLLTAAGISVVSLLPGPASAASTTPETVRVYAFPAPDTYPHVHGAKVPMIPVGSTTMTDMTSKTFSVSLSGLPAGTTNVVAIGLSGDSIVGQDFFPATKAGTYTRTFPAIGKVSTTTINPAAATSATPAVVTCTTYFDQSLGTPWGDVGGTFATTNGGTSVLSYTQDASSSIGVGTSATGAAGSFSASGTNSISSSGTVTFPTEWFSYGSHHFKTEFVENEYYNFCYDTVTGASSYTYFNKVDGWAGGANLVSVNSITANNCVVQLGGSSFTKSTTKAWTFPAGMSIPFINFNASTVTGYSTTANVTYSFNPGDNRHLCGVNSYPGGSSPLLLQVEP